MTDARALGTTAATPPEGAPAALVHDLPGAVAALTAADGRGVVLVSAPGAAAQMGAPWFLALVRQAATVAPRSVPYWAVLDCGDAPGHALAALRAGLRLLILAPTCPAYRAVATAAQEVGATLWPSRPARLLDLRRLDLRKPAGQVRLAAWFAAETTSG